MFDEAFRKDFPCVTRWFQTCVHQPPFKAVLKEVQLCKERQQGKGKPCDQASQGGGLSCLQQGQLCKKRTQGSSVHIRLAEA